MQKKDKLLGTINPPDMYFETTEDLKTAIKAVEQIDGPNEPLKKQVGGNHYIQMAIQPLDFIVANNLNFCQGNVIKYVTRYQFKNGIEDLEKARHYIDVLIEQEMTND